MSTPAKAAKKRPIFVFDALGLKILSPGLGDIFKNLLFMLGIAFDGFYQIGDKVRISTCPLLPFVFCTISRIYDFVLFYEIIKRWHHLPGYFPEPESIF